LSNRTILYYGDLVGSATLTASTEVAGYEKEFIQDYTPSSKWLPSADPSSMLFNFTTVGQLQSAIWVGGSNLVAADTTYTYGTGTTAAATDTVTALDKQENSFLELLANKRYGKLSITKAAGNGQVGKVYVAEYKLELPKDFDRNYTGGTLTEFVTNTGRYGQINREVQYSKYINSFSITGMGDTQKELLDETIRKEKNIIFWDGELQKPFFGILVLGQPEFVRSNTTGAIWNMSGSFEEAL